MTFSIRRLGPACLVGLIAPALALPASGCTGTGCGNANADGFFLGMIISPDDAAADGSALANRAPANRAPAATPRISPLPENGGPVVIAPATGRTAPDPEPDPTTRVTIRQDIIPGSIIDGGYVAMRYNQVQRTDTTPVPAASSVTIDLGDGVEAWRHVRTIDLPVYPAWSLHPLSQAVDITIHCGACRQGGRASLTGGGVLELGHSEIGVAGPGPPPPYNGRIRDMDLQAPDGPSAKGEMHFTLTGAGGALIAANLARLRLDFGDYSTRLRLHLLVWLQADGRVGGAFTGITDGDPADPRLPDPGGIAGYLSGAACFPVCGAEN